jgi:hypothetical protein
MYETLQVFYTTQHTTLTPKTETPQSPGLPLTNEASKPHEPRTQQTTRDIQKTPQSGVF